MSEFEITALVLSEHDAFRRAFTELQDTGDGLDGAWRELAQRLEVHAAAEEDMFYPQLAHDAEDGAEQGETAVREHNDIRHAVARVSELSVGSDEWWEAVRTAQEVNAEHMAEEETDFLPAFRDAVDSERREDLGMRWLQFHDTHDRAQGLSGDDADPEAVIAADPAE